MSFSVTTIPDQTASPLAKSDLSKVAEKLLETQREKLAQTKQPQDEALIEEIYRLGKFPHNTEFLRFHFNQLHPEDVDCVFREESRHGTAVIYYYIDEILEHLIKHGNGEFVYWLCHGADSKFKDKTCPSKKNEWLAGIALINGDFVTFDRFFKFAMCYTEYRDSMLLDFTIDCIRARAFDSLKYLLEFVNYSDLSIEDKDTQVLDALADASADFSSKVFDLMHFDVTELPFKPSL